MEREVGGCDWGCAAVARARFCLRRESETATSRLEEIGKDTTGYVVRLPFRGGFYLLLDEQTPRSYIHMQEPDNLEYKHGQSSRCSLCS